MNDMLTKIGHNFRQYSISKIEVIKNKYLTKNVLNYILIEKIPMILYIEN